MMNKFVFPIIAATLAVFALTARSAPALPEDLAAPEERETASVAAPAEVREEGRVWQSPETLDSLLSVMKGESTVAMFENFFDDFLRIDTTRVLTSEIPDSVYQKRLRSILTPIGMPWNDITKQYIISFTTSKRQLISNVLSRSQYYFPIIEQELSNADLPLELRMLPVIESALITSARSPAGAVGLWQFMHATGREYGLKITTFVDERRDPVAATRAACRYFKFLYRLYGDWSLVLAAYNCGPGNVNKALKLAGADARTYWDIYNYLPAETRGYVPSFIAVTYAYTFHKQHGIEIAETTLPLAVDTVSVDRLVHLDQIATTLDIPLETLRTLNSQYIKDIVPALDKPYPVVLPQRNSTDFIGRAEEVHLKDSLYLAEYINPANITETRARINSTGTVHSVKSGETLGHIAIKYGVTQSQILRWNNLKNANRLSIGQRLQILK